MLYVWTRKIRVRVRERIRGGMKERLPTIEVSLFFMSRGICGQVAWTN